jgi:hypothetical protein
VIQRLLRRSPKRRPYLAACEYWVYSPEEKLPPQELLMTRLLRSSPFQVGDEPPLGHSEGLLFSDIRLNITLALRSKNPHHYRPDLFADHIEPTAEGLTALAEAKSFVKARFVSEEPLPDPRHLRLMPFLVEAIAYYCRSAVVFDVISERLMMVESLRDSLREDAHAERSCVHLRTVWLRAEQGGKGATRGLLKVGLPEIETPVSPTEHQTIIMSVLDDAAEQMWDNRQMPERLSVSYFGDEFEVQIEPRTRGPNIARIMRIGSA